MTKLKDITVWKQIYDPHADGYLVAGKLLDSTSEKPFVMGWRARHGRRLHEPKQFKSKGWLTRSFRDALANDDWPHKISAREDHQANRLYTWEETYLMPHAPRLNQNQARQVIRQICHDYDLDHVPLRWRKKGTRESGVPTSHYSPHDNSITFEHRDLVSLLHELGHAIHDKEDENDKGAHHSPAFARICLSLYHRYAGFPIDYLMITANKCNLLGDIKSEQIIFDPATLRPQIHVHHSAPPRNPSVSHFRAGR